jgi:hypothetical protein
VHTVTRRVGVAAILVAAILVAALGTGLSAAAPAASSPLSGSSVFTVAGFPAPGTPSRYDQVMVRRFGSPTASKVLVLVPGDIGGAGDFNIVGPYLAAHVPGLQVWAEMRREGALEDNSVLLKALHGHVTRQDAFNYYLGWLDNPAISPHYQPLDPKQYGFVDQWGLNVAMEDLHAVILKARDHGHRTVILGGHSLGGAEAAIYPTWDFNGRGGYQDIAGIVGIDGGALGSLQGSVTTVAQAQAALEPLATKGPWQDLLGLGLPWITGPFAELGALNAYQDPNGPSLQQQFPLLPAEFKPSVPATNLAQLGYAFDASTSPAALALIHVHSGHLAAAGTPRGWVNTGPTPAQNIAAAFAQEPLGAVDWYFPMRLGIDVQAAGTLQQTPAAQYLGLHLLHLHQVDVPLYVIQTSLGGTDNAVANGAKQYQRESKIPSVEIVNRASTYSHLDPLLAAPAHNAFLQTVVPWLNRIH